MKKSKPSEYASLPDEIKIFHRTDGYMGSSNPVQSEMYTLPKDQPKFELKFMDVSPALKHMFTEIAVNAADNVSRSRKHGIKPGSIIINIDSNTIEIINFGRSFEVNKMKSKHEHKGDVWIPSEMFEEITSSSNYDDTVVREEGGKNGTGAGAVNALSEFMEVEIGDSDRKRHFYQKWIKPNYTAEYYNKHKDGMSPDIARLLGARLASAPQIEENYDKKSFVRVKFKPCFARFEVDNFSDDWIDMFRAEAHYLAYCTLVPVKFNGEWINYTESARSFYKLFDNSHSGNDWNVKSKNKNEVVGKWCFTVYSSDSKVKTTSFVNGTPTKDGGTHITELISAITNAYCEYLKEIIYKDDPSKRRAIIKSVVEHLSFVVKLIVSKPDFNSQTKDKSSSKVGKLVLKSDHITKVIDLTEEITEKYKAAKRKEANKKLEEPNKKDNKAVASKLEDSNCARKKRWSDENCLNVTEGDTAVPYMQQGLNDSDHNGFLPMRGKCKNVSDCDIDTVMKSPVLLSIIKAMGFIFDRDYEFSTQGLRYAKIRICTDQDFDGFHIQSLFVNFIATYWPGFIKAGRLSVLNSPIVRAMNGKAKLSFFSMDEFNEWQKTAKKGWNIVYCKGLGSSSEAEYIIDDFKNGVNEMVIKWDKNALKNLSLAFSDKTSAKKQILSTYNGTEYTKSRTEITVSDLIYYKWAPFAIYNMHRALPLNCDGLKPSVRKVMFVLYNEYKRKNISDESKTTRIGVNTLAGQVIKDADYHHGEASLYETITRLARGYTGNSNLPLEFPGGNFGTRLKNGEDRSPARYIKTCPRPYFYHVFRKEDDAILPYSTNSDNGLVMDPDHFLPIIPLQLVQNDTGIGSGWSTTIPPYNVDNVIKCLIRLLKGFDVNPDELVPYYRYYTGRVIAKLKNLDTNELIVEKVKGESIVVGTTGKPHIIIKAVYSMKEDKDGNLLVKIDDIPPGIAFNDVSAEYDKLKDDGFLLDYTRISNVLRFQANIVISKNGRDSVNSSKELEDKLYLRKVITLNNMYLIDYKTKLPKKYNNALEILQDFVDYRLKWYDVRKEYYTKKLKDDLLSLQNQIKMIKLIHNGTISLYNKNNTAKELEEVANILSSNKIDYNRIDLKSTSHSVKSLEKYEISVIKIQEQIDQILSQSSSQMMIKELKELQVVLNKYYSEVTIDVKIEHLLKTLIKTSERSLSK